VTDAEMGKTEVFIRENRDHTDDGGLQINVFGVLV
jgi:hypothetical protein